MTVLPMATMVPMPLAMTVFSVAFSMGIRTSSGPMITVACIAMGGQVGVNNGHPQGQGDRDRPQT